MNFFKKPKPEKNGGAFVQTAPRESFAERLNGFLPLKTAEHRLYEEMRQSVPIIDAALEKIVRLVGGFKTECKNAEAEKLLCRFAQEVPVGGVQAGLDAFLSCYLSDLLTYGNAAGEIVLSEDGSSIYALYNSPLTGLEVGTPQSPLQVQFYLRNGLNLSPAPNPELILFSARNPAAGEIRGVSLLRGLPFISNILLRIYECIGKNFDRVGNVRFAVTYKPGEAGSDPATAREIAESIAKEWGEAMSATAKGSVKDFVAVGDVDIKVIGADNQIIDTKIPVEQMLQQIVSKLGIPPFLLGLSWSTTERMSKQQADILTSELEAYRRLLTPIIKKICGLFLAMNGFTDEINVNWDNINLQDEIEEAQAQLLLAQAAKESEGIK
ncbi:MAG: serine/threonine protein phosphatase [Hydrogenoanaerobacterium sp.]